MCGGVLFTRDDNTHSKSLSGKAIILVSHKRAAQATMSAEQPKILTKQEQEKIKNELEDFEDEFDDAVENEGEIKDGDGNFGVSKEELSIIRAELACEFPEDYDYLRLVS